MSLYRFEASSLLSIPLLILVLSFSIFHFSIDKIAVSFELKMEGCFLEFEVGGQSIEDETEETIEKPKTKKIKKPDGTVEEKEIIETVNLKVCSAA